jgi:hypothetical protein
MNTRMNQGQVDWNTELRRIERQFDGLPPEPSASVVKARKAAEQRLKEQVEHRVAVISSVARLLLVAALAGALRWWPYATDCGVDLASFLGAQLMVVVGGLWAAVHSWRHRLPACHAAAMLLLVAGLALIAAQVLPRLGYATIAGIHATAWGCR